MESSACADNRERQNGDCKRAARGQASIYSGQNKAVTAASGGLPATVRYNEKVRREDLLMAKTNRKKTRHQKPATKKPAAKNSIVPPLKSPVAKGRPQTRSTNKKNQSRPAVANPVSEGDSTEVERSLAKLLPNTLEGTTIAESPESLFTRLRGIPLSDRPGVICLDGRSCTTTDVVTWLERFDAVNHELEKVGDDPWKPQCVIILPGSALQSEDLIGWLTKTYLYWLPTKDKRSSVAALYRRHLQEDLRSFLRPDLNGMFSAKPDTEASPATNFIPKQMKAAWQARINELDALPGTD
jgi:hypothetical protein